MFQVKRLVPEAIVPSRSSDESAGLDLYSIENITIPSKDRRSIRTGLLFLIPLGCFVRILPKFSLADKYGVDVMAGIVDSATKSEVRVILMNNGDSNFEVKVGDKIGKVVLESSYRDECYEFL